MNIAHTSHMSRTERRLRARGKWRGTSSFLGDNYKTREDAERMAKRGRATLAEESPYVPEVVYDAALEPRPWLIVVLPRDRSVSV